ncbi:DNA-3-methyladenine glycosylase 1 [Tetrabaena socialis]|uniref:DNA-3-methyladenine glycosylase 1 n=1 Tax=Tetrabaena socialis TaxID=47790 RepID=A0A2J7ZUU6_9CHLO|nr:DNA-3-methyladenine glycosylase 1 [Tetrabaena socialis]|eukprot:PNH04019.1 DNA-3-methyladenine glycosylase 1 [Tetrabaena socialis]
MDLSAARPARKSLRLAQQPELEQQPTSPRPVAAGRKAEAIPEWVPTPEARAAEEQPRRRAVSAPESPPPPRPRRGRKPAAAASALAAEAAEVAAAPEPPTPPPSRRRAAKRSRPDTGEGEAEAEAGRGPAPAPVLQQREQEQGGAAVVQGDSPAVQGGPPVVLRCAADLAAAVAHLRARDPRLAPLIEAHGLPLSLVTVARAAAAAATTVAAAPASATAAAVAAAAVSAVASAPAGADADFDTAANAAAGAVPTNDDESGGVFSALSRSVVYQQLATSAANAIWGRVLVACQAPTAAHLTPQRVLAAPSEALRGAGLSGRKVEYLVGMAEAFAAKAGWDEQLAATSDLEFLVSELTSIRGIGVWSVHMLAMFRMGLPDVLPYSDLGVRRGLALLHGLKELPGPAQMEAMTEAWRPYRSVGCWYMWRIPAPPRNTGPKEPKSKKAGAGGPGSGGSKPAARKAQKAR